MSRKQKVFKKGFTVVGLIVAVAIVAVLGIIIFISGQSNEAKARDSKRVSELNTLKAALQLYHMDHGNYPIEDNDWCSIELSEMPIPILVGMPASCGNFKREMKSYLSEIPGDPLYPKIENEKIYSYQYITITFGDEYKIHANLESGDAFEVYSAGGAVIGYVPPDPEGGCSLGPPTLLTYNEEPGTIPENRVLRGAITAFGSVCKTIERGFVWKLGRGGPPYSDRWIDPGDGSGDWPLGYYSQEISGFVAPAPPPGEVSEPGVCYEYCYRAVAQDFKGGWGYAGTEDCFPACTE